MKPITERLTMLENDMYVAPKDWMKRIRAEIQHIRQAHAKAMKKNWAEQKAALEKQIQQLRSALHTAEKSAEDSKRKLEQQQKQAEAEHRELADLREIVFNRDIVDEAEDVAVDNAVYPYTVQKSTVVFGGHETWVKALKPLLKGDIKFIAREMKIDVSLVRYADVIWIQSNAIPHRSYYSIVNTARKLGKPIRYFTNASAAKCAEQIVENGEWIMRGLPWDDPYRIRTWQELVNWVNEIGFLPLFANDITGFSAEEHVSPDYWWTGDKEQDPWEWREIIAASHKVAYGKFFGGKAGFISKEWLPYFANYRRSGYDFDSRYEDGLATYREKVIMDYYIGEDGEGDMLFKQDAILSTELKKMAGFGKGGLKNYPGIITGLQMQLYLVISDFQRRKNKKGAEYGMSVSVMFPPETIWGYDLVTSAYIEEPVESWQRIYDHVKKLYPDSDNGAVIGLIGKKPID